MQDTIQPAGKFIILELFVRFLSLMAGTFLVSFFVVQNQTVSATSISQDFINVQNDINDIFGNQKIDLNNQSHVVVINSEFDRFFTRYSPGVLKPIEITGKIFSIDKNEQYFSIIFFGANNRFSENVMVVVGIDFSEAEKLFRLKKDQTISVKCQSIDRRMSRHPSFDFCRLKGVV